MRLGILLAFAPDRVTENALARRYDLAPAQLARILRRIRDRRVVHVYDIGTLDDGRPYFVMDYADGGSFDRLRKQLLRERRRTSQPRGTVRESACCSQRS